ncbi:MAG TPA: hypothetical protein PKD45_09640 [Flavobacteriales bacterium]|nr:hypothetical protein [Flavobacteriales bacterium]
MHRRSLYAVLLGCLTLLTLRTAAPPRNVLTWDVFGYYLYLPATVIHHDVALQDRTWLDEVMARYEPSGTLYQLVDGPDGRRVIKYSAGMAVLYAPFFLIAHGVAPLSGHPADGFSPPYQYILAYGCLLYAFLGLFVFRRVLLHFFSDGLAAALILLTVFGTNYLHLAAWDGTLLTHTPLFLLYALLLQATIRWHDLPGLGHALQIGLWVGLITLVRPSEGVALLIPLLWLPKGQGWRAKWAMVRARPGQLLAAAAAFLVAVSPQAIYWHIVTGQWIFYSYVNPGEGFDFFPPHLANFLFSYRKGWLLYTPLMVLALAGIPLLWRKEHGTFWAIALFTVANLWVVSAWTTWWYAGGSFSSRSMVPAYTVLALPLGHALRALSRHRMLRVVTGLFIGGAVLLNLFQTWQWKQGILPKDRVTKAYYRAIFGRTSVPAGADTLLMVERSTGEGARFTDEGRYTRRLLCHYTFDDEAEGSFLLTEGTPWSPGPDIPFSELTAHDHAWLRISARLWVGDSLPAGPPPVLVATFHHLGQTYEYRTGHWELPPGVHNQWVSAHMDYLTPEARSPQDNLKVYAWNGHGGNWRVDDLRVEVWEPKVHGP